MSKYIDFNQFRDSTAAQKMAKILSNYSGNKVTIMEVCGTHTMSIFKYGIRAFLSKDINLISGPGCPVCVTPSSYIEQAVFLSRMKDVVIATFGDMMRVPSASGTSLSKEKSLGADIRVLYSPLDVLKIAEQNKNKQVVLLSIGFETTTPVIALTIINAYMQNIKNLKVLTANKTVPKVLEILAKDKTVGIDAYLYPGHVSAIIGMNYYEELMKKYNVSGVVAGFEPLDVMNAIITLVSDTNQKKPILENQYSRVVKQSGNIVAVEKMYEVFEKCDSIWRGLGNIKDSGLCINSKYANFDAWRAFGLTQTVKEEYFEGCICGDVLKGIKKPPDCKMFGKVCTPENPVGACMVSSEGTCAAYYKYGIEGFSN